MLNFVLSGRRGDSFQHDCFDMDPFRAPRGAPLGVASRWEARGVARRSHARRCVGGRRQGRFSVGRPGVIVVALRQGEGRGQGARGRVRVVANSCKWVVCRVGFKAGVNVW